MSFSQSWRSVSAEDLRVLAETTVISSAEPPVPLGVYSPLTSLDNARSAYYLFRHGLGPAIDQPRPTLSLSTLRTHQLPLQFPPSEVPPVLDSLTGPAGDRAITPKQLL